MFALTGALVGAPADAPTDALTGALTGTPMLTGFFNGEPAGCQHLLISNDMLIDVYSQNSILRILPASREAKRV